MSDIISLSLNLLLEIYYGLHTSVLAMFQFLNFEINATVVEGLINFIGGFFPNFAPVSLSFTVGEAIFGSGLVTLFVVIIVKWFTPFV